MRWMLFVVVLLLAMASSAAIIIHGASLSLSIPFLMLGWLMRFLFPSKQPPGSSSTTLLALTHVLTRRSPK